VKINRVMLAVLIIGSFVTFNACFLNQTKGNGNVITQERTANNFSNVVLDIACNVNIHYSENYKVAVITDSNIQDIITINVNGNNLHIDKKNTNTGFNSTKLEIDVYMPQLNGISLNAAGNIKVNNGNTSELNCSISGTGNIDAQEFQAKNVTINLSGAGNVKIWATDNINGSLSGTGNISYKGNPEINVNKTGTGNIKPL